VRPRPASTGLWTIGFLGLHVPVALAMDASPQVAGLHAIATLAIGLWWATVSDRQERVAWSVAYITGAEVLWRMTGAPVYWEFGKYAAAAIFFVALLRHGRLRPALLPLSYFVLLLPSVPLTLTSEATFTSARDQISFNLSGPLALMLSGWFFSKVRLSAKDLRWLLIALIAPVVGVASLAARGALSGDVVFGTSSNMIASGGFGPNQVSAILGLAAMFALLAVLEARSGLATRLVMAGALVWFVVQSALTFSRSGLYMVAGGVAVAACFLLGDARIRTKLVPLLVALFIAGNYFVAPYLNAFTGGALGTRFQNTYLTGRDRMILADIDMWKANLVLGVGPGEARLVRNRIRTDEDVVGPGRAMTGAIAAHTEFSRLVAEHGLFGLAAMLCLIVAGVVNVRRMPDTRTRGLAAGLNTWSALFMLSDGMRILAPSLLIGLCFASLPAEGVIGGTAATTPGAVHPRPLVSGHPSLRRRRRATGLP